MPLALKNEPSIYNGLPAKGQPFVYFVCKLK